MWQFTTAISSTSGVHPPGYTPCIPLKTTCHSLLSYTILISCSTSKPLFLKHFFTISIHLFRGLPTERLLAHSPTYTLLAMTHSTLTLSSCKFQALTRDLIAFVSFIPPLFFLTIFHNYTWFIQHISQLLNSETSSNYISYTKTSHTNHSSPLNTIPLILASTFRSFSNISQQNLPPLPIHHTKPAYKKPSNLHSLPSSKNTNIFHYPILVFIEKPGGDMVQHCFLLLHK